MPGVRAPHRPPFLVVRGAPVPAAFDGLCHGTGGCVDLDGSTKNPGVFSTVVIFAAGTYKLDFGLFGSLRIDDPNSVTISLGSWSVVIASILSGADASGSIIFTTTIAGNLTFENSGGDNIGAVLTSVELSAVPVPAALPLLAAGLAGLVLLGRRNKRKAPAIAA